MEIIKVGFVGVGGIASLHLKNISENEHAHVTAVCDIVEEQARQNGVKYGAKAYTDVDKMLEKEELDALFVCVPPFAHKNIEEKAADRGIHLMVEKPLGLSLDIVQKKMNKIQESGIIHASGYCLRYMDSVAKAKDYLKDKDIAMIRGNYLSSFVPTPWYREKKKSGGQLVEQATHVLDMMRYLGGEVERVYANMSLQTMMDIENLDIPDVTSVNCTFESGAIGHLDSTIIQTDHRMGVEFLGRDFRVELTGTALSIVEKDQTVIYKSTNEDFYLVEDHAFIEAVRTGNRDLILADYEDGIKTLAVTLAANQSEETGQPITMSSFYHIVPSNTHFERS